MNNINTVAELCRKHAINARQLAEQSGLEEGTVVAIVLGRWTPSPDERRAIASIFGLSPSEIVWGHTTPVQHLYGQGPA